MALRTRAPEKRWRRVRRPWQWPIPRHERAPKGDHHSRLESGLRCSSAQAKAAGAARPEHCGRFEWRFWLGTHPLMLAVRAAVEEEVAVKSRTDHGL